MGNARPRPAVPTSSRRLTSARRRSLTAGAMRPPWPGNARAGTNAVLATRAPKSPRIRHKRNGRPPLERGELSASGSLAAPSRALLTLAEMLVVERKRVRYFAAGSGGMQQPNGLSGGGVRLLPFRGCGSRAWQRPGPAPVGQTAEAPLSIERLVGGGIRSYRVDAVVNNQPIDCRLGCSDPRPMRVNIGCDAPRAIGGPDKRGRPA
jgi:hypothetical protein